MPPLSGVIPPQSVVKGLVIFDSVRWDLAPLVFTALDTRHASCTPHTLQCHEEGEQGEGGAREATRAREATEARKTTCGRKISE